MGQPEIESIMAEQGIKPAGPSENDLQLLNIDSGMESQPEVESIIAEQGIKPGPSTENMKSAAENSQVKTIPQHEGVKPIADILARKCLMCNGCEKVKKVLLTKHIMEVHRITFKICKACKLIFKVKGGDFKLHYCDPNRPKPKPEKVKKSPKKSEAVPT